MKKLFYFKDRIVKKYTLFVIFIFFNTTSIFTQSINDLIEANKLYNEEKWIEAAEIYNRIVKENSNNGEYWNKLGWANYSSKNYENAILAYKNAFEVGYKPSSVSYNIACAYSLLGKKEMGLKWLEVSIEKGLRGREELLASDADLGNLRKESGFQRFVAKRLNKNISRDEKWKRDILYMKKMFELTHYQLSSLVTKEKWEKSFTYLLNDMPNLKDHQIVVRLMEIAVTIGVGHSYVVPPFSGSYQFHQLPIELYSFTDGIFVRKAKKQYKHIVGLKIVSIENVPVNEILEKVKKVANPENRIISNWTGLFYATLPEVLETYGFIKDIENVHIQVQNKKGKKISITINSQMFTPEIIMNKTTPKGWISMNEKSKNKLPLYLKNLENEFWFEYQKDIKIVYCQLNQIRNKGNQSLKDFGKELATFIKKNEVNALVLDIRLNNGGNGLLNRDFLLEIIKAEKINQKGKFYTIIGRKTFSAAMLLTTQLDQYTETIFIGESTGGKPSHIGDDNPIVLPYSGITASAAMTYWQSAISYDQRNWIAPEIKTSLSSEDYFNNQDPSMNLMTALFNK